MQFPVAVPQRRHCVSGLCSAADNVFPCNSVRSVRYPVTEPPLEKKILTSTNLYAEESSLNISLPYIFSMVTRIEALMMQEHRRNILFLLYFLLNATLHFRALQKYTFSSHYVDSKTVSRVHMQGKLITHPLYSQ